MYMNCIGKGVDRELIEEALEEIMRYREEEEQRFADALRKSIMIAETCRS